MEPEDISPGSLPGSRYRWGELLGRGAMGRVVEAWDPILERSVALKVLHGDDPEWIERLLREARVQARIDHPNVCRVYEVGEAEGRPFIAMQRVRGRDLLTATRGLPLERKVRLLATVADAVQAAHEAGLIHRDLKPANVLVEERDDGAPAPYVLDFGLARDPDVRGPTRTGQLVGTPAYMSPEQARGEVERLDRRTDVWSLGVILYELAVGQPPFAGDSFAGVLRSVVEDEPPRPSRLRARVPRDLERVIEKCLEKEPGQRYPSARALADDLERWLAGEPVQARPVGWVRRTGKHLRRHPMATAFGVVTFVALVALGAVWWQARWQLRERSRIAERVGRQVERMESQMRLAHLLPLHDVRPDRQRVEADMVALEKEMERLGPIARGPGLYALGRGFQSLGRHQPAREHLEAAWHEGYRTPETALALGRTWTALYLDRLARVDRFADPELRRAERERARRELGDPALRYLEAADAEELRLAAHERAYLEGLILLHEGKLETARDRARRATARIGWFYEGLLLAGRVEREQATTALQAHDFEPALAGLERARELLADAGSRAPSDPEVHLALCETWYQQTQWERNRGRDPEPAFRQAVDACGGALIADPTLERGLDLRSLVAWLHGQHRVRKGRDPAESLALAIGDARRLLKLDPGHAQAWSHLGNAFSVQATWELEQGRDPTPHLDQAVEYFHRAVELAPGDGFLLLSLGHALSRRGTYRAWRGEAPMASFRAAEEIYERAFGQERAVASRLWNGLCSVRTSTGYHLFERGEDPERSYERAAEACREALALAPGYLSALSNLGLTWWSQAQLEMRRGDDPEASFAAAEEAFEQVLTVDPSAGAASVNLTGMLIDRARWGLEHGEDAQMLGELLGRAEKYNQTVGEIYPADSHLFRSRIELLRARRAIQRGSSPEPAFDTALEAGLRGAGHQPEMAVHWEQVVAVERARAEWLASLRPVPVGQARKSAETALKWVRRGLEADPGRAEIQRHREALQALVEELSRMPPETP